MTHDNRAANAAEERERGSEALRAGEELLRLQLYNDAISRAYYAAYHWARAVLFTEGLETIRDVTSSCGWIRGRDGTPCRPRPARSAGPTFAGATTSDAVYKPHRGVNQLLGLHFVRTGNLSEEATGILARLEDRRESSDYSASFRFTAEEAQEAVQAARRFISLCRPLLAAP